MVTKEERTINIRSCKLDKSALKQICELLEEEKKPIKNVDQESRVYLNFAVESKKKTITTDTTDSFLNLLPKSFTQITLYFSTFTNDKQIFILLSFSDLNYARVIVKGVDSIWTGGITTKIADLFEEYETKNWIANKLTYRIPLAIPIAMLIGAVITFLELPTSYNEWNEEQFYNIVYLSAIVIFPLIWIMGWLFPKIEYENMLIPTRLRRRIFVALGSIAGAAFSIIKLLS